MQVKTAGFNETVAALKPDVLIMDIEGGELDVLKDADLSSIRAVVLEFHPGAYGIEGMRTCKDILKKAGFERIESHSTRTVWACERKA